MRLTPSFFVNFKLKDIETLSNCISEGKGFILKHIFHHPRRKHTFILEIQGFNHQNLGLSINLLHEHFTVNNQKKVTPNLLLKEIMTIEEFELKYKVTVGRPRS